MVMVHLRRLPWASGTSSGQDVMFPVSPPLFRYLQRGPSFTSLVQQSQPQPRSQGPTLPWSLAYRRMAFVSWEVLLRHFTYFAESLADVKTGNSSAARMAIIAMTTRS